MIGDDILNRFKSIQFGSGLMAVYLMYTAGMIALLVIVMPFFDGLQSIILWSICAPCGALGAAMGICETYHWKTQNHKSDY